MKLLTKNHTWIYRTLSLWMFGRWFSASTETCLNSMRVLMRANTHMHTIDGFFQRIKQLSMNPSKLNDAWWFYLCWNSTQRYYIFIHRKNVHFFVSFIWKLTFFYDICACGIIDSNVWKWFSNRTWKKQMQNLYMQIIYDLPAVTI